MIRPSTALPTGQSPMSPAVIPWRKLVPKKLTFAQPEDEIFYAKKENIDSLRLIDVSMVSHYFTKGDIKGCKKTVREFWDNVEKKVISPQQCVLIAKKCSDVLTAIRDAFRSSANCLRTEYAIVDIKKTQVELDYLRAGHTAKVYFELNDEDLSLVDYFVLRCHILSLVFINHQLRLHVKLTIANIESKMLKRTAFGGENPLLQDDLPSTAAMQEHLLSPTPVESLIEEQWILGPVNAKCITMQYPSFEGMKLEKMEEKLQKIAAGWKNYNESKGG